MCALCLLITKIDLLSKFLNFPNFYRFNVKKFKLHLIQTFCFIKLCKTVLINIKSINFNFMETETFISELQQQ